MTQVFDENNRLVPVTVVKAGPCVVTQVRTPEVDGYSAVQVGWGEIKPRNSTIPMIGHDAKAGAAPKRTHCEFRTAEGEAVYWSKGRTAQLEGFPGGPYDDCAMP